MSRIKILFIFLIISFSGYSQLSEDFNEAPTVPVIIPLGVPHTWQLDSGSWKIINKHGAQVSWARNPNNTSTPAYSGNYAAYLNRENVFDTEPTPEDWLVTPQVNLANVTNPELTFYSRLTMALDQGSIYKVMVSTTSQTDINTFTMVKTWTEYEINPLVNASYNKVTVDLTPYTGSQIYVAFVMIGDWQERWLIDDITIGMSCPKPLNLSVSDITATSAKLEWDVTASGNYEVEVVNYSEAPSGSGTIVPQNQFTANNLLEGNNYKFFVRSVCEPVGSNNSDWAGPFEFRTINAGTNCSTPLVIPSGLPYIKTAESFKSVATPFISGDGCGAGAGSHVRPYYTVYQYIPTSSSNIDITVNSMANETAIFIYDSCNNFGINCLTGTANLLPLEKKIIDFPIDIYKTYYIVVASAVNNPYSIVISKSCYYKPVSTFTINGNCDGVSAFSAIANVTSLGGATSLLATLYKNGVAVNSKIVSAPGIVSFPWNSVNDKVYISLQNQQNLNCMLMSKELSVKFCPPSNDNCNTASVLNVSTSNMVYSATGSLIGATASTEISNCPGTEDDDVWYEFTAIAEKQLIEIKTIAGDNIDISHTVYQGDSCGNLEQLYCDNDGLSIANNLVPGMQYKIRVYSTGATPADTTFRITTTGFPFTCMDDNPQSIIVKSLFKSLINYLLTFEGDSTQPFTCPQLTALAPYITAPNPKIYNLNIYKDLAANYGSISFSFSNHGDDPDVWINFPMMGLQVTDINFYSYSGPDVAENVHIRLSDGTISDVRNSVKHIDFCPVNPPCNQATGSIDINPGVSCVTVGNATGFNFITEDTDISGYHWVFYKDDEVVATSQLGGAVQTFMIEGEYAVKLTVTSQSGCKTVFRRIFSVRNTCTENCVEDASWSVEYYKSSYIKLINKLFEVYGTGNPNLPTTYMCTELLALEGAVNYGKKLYNVRYDASTSMLRFSFTEEQDSNYFDVEVKYHGFITDIDITNSDGSWEGNYYPTVYENGITDTLHYIQHISFCACNYNQNHINFEPGLSCAQLNTPITFSSKHTGPEYSTYWYLYKDDNEVAFYTMVPNFTYTFTSSGVYTVVCEQEISTNCGTYITKQFTVSENCDNCTDSNSKTKIVKDLYFELANYLVGTYPEGAVIPNPIECAQLNALAPYITDPNPKIYNLHYNSGKLRFSFGNHGTDFDVELPAGNLVVDLNLSNYTSSELLTEYTFLEYPTWNNIENIQKIRHIDFCPSVDCPEIAGNIKLNGHESCVPINKAQGFYLDANTTNVVSYKWTFYDAQGSVYSTNTLPDPVITYNLSGNYMVQLTIKDYTGCEFDFYKTITVSASCGDSCAETNEDSRTVKELYIEFLNYVIAQSSLVNGSNNAKLTALAPYISLTEPRIYNPYYMNNGQKLSFAFGPDENDQSVVVERLGVIADINLVNYTSSENSQQYIVTYTNGLRSFLHTAKHINFCPPPLPCESHIAFVIDESASIKEQEIFNIKDQLRKFVEQQYQDQTGNTISFTGMSDSDTNTRTDHVLGKIMTEADKNMFLNWISNYHNGYTQSDIAKGISPNSDYWASGLKYVMDKSLVPTIVIILTDGSQTADINGLKQIVKEINLHAKLFVYGAADGYYVDGVNKFEQLVFNSTIEKADGWSTELYHTTEEPLFSYDTSITQTGSYSLKVHQPNSDYSQLYVGSTDYIDVDNQQATNYTFSGWVYNPNANAEITLVMYNGQGISEENEVQIDKIPAPASATWQYVEMTVLAPAYVKKINMRLDNSGPGEAWFDNLTIARNPIIDPNGNNPVSLVSSGLKTSLKYLLDMEPKDVLPESFDNFLQGVYYGDTSKFTELRNEERYFSNNLVDGGFGCGGEFIVKDSCDDCETFQPEPGKTYWLSAWVKEEQNIQVHSYTNAKINLIFEDGDKHELETLCFIPSGEIIDGWQRIAAKFKINDDTSVMKVELINLSQGIPAYFDDIRIHPVNGSMKSFVYDPETLRLMAELDDNNYSTFYEYDNEGGLIRIKKETSKGIMTIQETRSGNIINSGND